MRRCFLQTLLSLYFDPTTHGTTYYGAAQRWATGASRPLIVLAAMERISSLRALVAEEAQRKGAARAMKLYCLRREVIPLDPAMIPLDPARSLQALLLAPRGDCRDWARDRPLFASVV